MRKSFSKEEAAKLSGLTPETLGNWIRSRFFLPSVQRGRGGRGDKHLYSFRDVIALRVVAALRSRGLTLQELRKVISYVRKHTGLSTTDALASRLLVTDGVDVYEADGISTLRAPGQRVLCIVPLTALVHEVQRGVSELDAA